MAARKMLQMPKIPRISKTSVDLGAPPTLFKSLETLKPYADVETVGNRQKMILKDSV
jgi:hypothetical protein